MNEGSDDRAWVSFNQSVARLPSIYPPFVENSWERPSICRSFSEWEKMFFFYMLLFFLISLPNVNHKAARDFLSRKRDASRE